VFEYGEQLLRVLFRLPIAGIRHAGWLDHDSYAISFEVSNNTFVLSGPTECRHQERVEVYRIKHIKTDNEDDPSEHKDVSWNSRYVQRSKVYNLLLTVHYTSNRPELICVLDIGQHDCITFSGHKELLITRLPEGGHQLQVTAFPITENLDLREPVSNKSASQVVWQTSNDDHEGTARVALTSALPLELDLLIQGYCGLSGIYMILRLTYLSLSSLAADGRIRQFSAVQIARKSDSSALLTSSSLKTSDPPLDGCIVALHVAQNPRTREKYIVGGADDGSIAFWSMR